ncbi:MAG: Maf family protein, partial [Gemmatimonadota bacterium]|nr:Maf family protein [Gemmatimonadota bacterium]
MSEADSPLPPLVLASASPRRSDILQMLGLRPRVRPASVEEARLPKETAAGYVERLAREKARAGALHDPEALVLGGDTVVVLDGDILEKPADQREAESMLLRLSGRDHDVCTGMALSVGGQTWSLVCRATVGFRNASAVDVRRYAATGEPLDKAGGYGIQGYGS